MYKDVIRNLLRAGSTSPSLICYLLVTLCVCSVGPVFGNAALTVEDLSELLRLQKEEIAALQRRLDALEGRNSPREDRADQDAKRVANSRQTKTRRTKRDVKASLHNGLRFRSADDRFAYKAGGRMHFDAAFYRDKRTSLGDGTALRRTRLFMSGKLFRDFKFRTEVDFTESGNIGARDAWFAYAGLEQTTIKAGQFQAPFSLEGMTSSNSITFMERSLPDLFAPSYHLGASASHYGSNWSGTVGVFGEPAHSKNDSVDDGWLISSRLTIAPIQQRRATLHAGFSALYQEPDSDREMRFRSRPESNVTNRRLVDTRIIDNVDNSVLVAGELAGVYGPILLQGEYVRAMVDRRMATSLNFDGWYAYASWFVTGESRSYNAKKGVFRRINPRHDFGAWELGLRFSSIDLSDEDIRGGREDNITIGLNWHVNKNVRLMANYIFVDVDPNRNGIDERPEIIQMRGQINF